MKSRLALCLATLIMASLACSVTVNGPEASTGPTEEYKVNEPLSDTKDTADVNLEMGAGTLTLDSGAKGLVDGTIEYNVQDWEPRIKRNSNGLTISQRNVENPPIFPTRQIVNNWNLKLGDVPMNLEIKAGAYDGDMELGGLRLQSLEINDGASKNTISFDDPNPEILDTLRYRTGASSVRFIKLANANCNEIDFEGGAGNYNFDFMGSLQRDLNVNIKAGVSNIDLAIPEKSPVKLIVHGGLKNVNTNGSWKRDCHNETCTYSQSGEGSTITLNVDMGLGNLTVVSK